MNINIIINIVINWLMTETKYPMTQMWVMTYRLGTTAIVCATSFLYLCSLCYFLFISRIRCPVSLN